MRFWRCDYKVRKGGGGVGVLCKKLTASLFLFLLVPATTISRVRTDCSRSFVKRFIHTDTAEVVGILRSLANQASSRLHKDGIMAEEQIITFEVDVRYKGQGLTVPVTVDIDLLQNSGLQW